VIASSLMLDAFTPSDSSPTQALTLLATNMTWVPEDAYLDRTGFGLSIRSTGWVPAFRKAIRAGQVPVFVHTHPSGRAAFSKWDDQVDQHLAASARDLGAPAYASIVVAGTPAAPAVLARICRIDTGGPAPACDSEIEFCTVDAVRVAGASLRLFLPPQIAPTDMVNLDDPKALENLNVGDGQPVSDAPIAASVFDRQIRMLGPEGQRTLGTLNVAVIGAGGTGSAVAVLLARLGIGGICLVDDDNVTAATPTRGHGMTMTDLGLSKVEVLGRHLRDIGLNTRVTEVQAQLHEPEALRAIAHADVVFSCVDGHGARLILNRFAYAHLTAVIDLAVLVAPQVTGGVEIDERVTWVAPGTACLLCRGRLDPARAYAENLDPETRRRLAGEGYVVDVETPQPAVVTLTTLIASLGTTEFLLRLTQLGSPEATELIMRPHLGDLRRNKRPSRPGCFCTDPEFAGRALRAPYLDLNWPEASDEAAS
jgi:molybdopterin/thiamine biosynthesis adenylyltransferase